MDAGLSDGVPGSGSDDMLSLPLPQLTTVMTIEIDLLWSPSIEVNLVAQSSVIVEVEGGCQYQLHFNFSC